MGSGASSKVQRYKSEPSKPVADGTLSSAAQTGTEESTINRSQSTKSSSSHKRKSGGFRNRQLKIVVTKPIMSNGRGQIRQTHSFAAEYTIGEEVMPSTNYGTTVYFARRVSDGKDVVVKLRSKAKSFKAGEDVHQAWRVSTEYLLNLPKNEHITELYEVLEDQEAYYVVMEKVDGLDLFETLGSPEVSDRNSIQQILIQLLDAVAVLHAKGYIHRDLKLENVMLSPTTLCKASGDESWAVGEAAGGSASPQPQQPLSGGSTLTCRSMSSGSQSPETKPLVKIIDFDTVEEYSPKNSAKVVMGTDMYIAQEAYAGQYSPASDIFAVGVIAYKLLSGKFPFADGIFAEGGDNTVGSMNMRQTQEAIKTFDIDWTRPPFDTDKDAKELCRWMLAPVNTARPTAKQALEHQWFKTLAGEIQ